MDQVCSLYSLIRSKGKLKFFSQKNFLIMIPKKTMQLVVASPINQKENQPPLKTLEDLLKGFSLNKEGGSWDYPYLVFVRPVLVPARVPVEPRHRQHVLRPGQGEGVVIGAPEVAVSVSHLHPQAVRAGPALEEPAWKRKDEKCNAKQQ